MEGNFLAVTNDLSGLSGRVLDINGSCYKVIGLTCDVNYTNVAHHAIIDQVYTSCSLCLGLGGGGYGPHYPPYVLSDSNSASYYDSKSASYYSPSASYDSPSAPYDSPSASYYSPPTTQPTTPPTTPPTYYYRPPGYFYTTPIPTTPYYAPSPSLNYSYYRPAAYYSRYGYAYLYVFETYNATQVNDFSLFRLDPPNQLKLQLSGHEDDVVIFDSKTSAPLPVSEIFDPVINGEKINASHKTTWPDEVRYRETREYDSFNSPEVLANGTTNFSSINVADACSSSYGPYSDNYFYLQKEYIKIVVRETNTGSSGISEFTYVKTYTGGIQFKASFTAATNANYMMFNTDSIALLSAHAGLGVDEQVKRCKVDQHDFRDTQIVAKITFN